MVHCTPCKARLPDRPPNSRPWNPDGGDGGDDGMLAAKSGDDMLGLFAIGGGGEGAPLVLKALSGGNMRVTWRTRASGITRITEMVAVSGAVRVVAFKAGN